MKPAPFAFLPTVASRKPCGPRRGAGREGAGRRPVPGPAAVHAAGRSLDARRHQRACPTSATSRGPRTASGSAPGPARRGARLGRGRAGPAAAGLALSHVAHPTIRNRGTTVGSIVHADAAAEMPVVLRLLEGRSTSRRCAVAVRSRQRELFAGPLSRPSAHDEIAVEAFFPGLAPGAGVAFQEIARRHGDYALVGVAAHVETDGEAVTAARVGSCRSATPRRRRRDRRGPRDPRATRRHRDWPWPSSTPPRTSMPPPPTAPPGEGAGAARAGGRATTPDRAGRRSTMTTEQLHDVRLTVNGVRPRRAGAGPPPAVRRAAPRPAA